MVRRAHRREAPILPIIYDEAGHRVATQISAERAEWGDAGGEATALSGIRSGIAGASGTGDHAGRGVQLGAVGAHVVACERRGDGQSGQGDHVARL